MTQASRRKSFLSVQSWPRIRALAAGERGVSGRAMRSASTGTSGAYLRASRTALGPVVWMMPGRCPLS